MVLIFIRNCWVLKTQGWYPCPLSRRLNTCQGLHGTEPRLWWVDVIIVESCLKFQYATPKNTSISLCGIEHHITKPEGNLTDDWDCYPSTVILEDCTGKVQASLTEMIKWSWLRKVSLKTGYEIAKQKIENQNKAYQFYKSRNQGLNCRLRSEHLWRKLRCTRKCN